jgi:phosphate transport system permease protein
LKARNQGITKDSIFRVLVTIAAAITLFLIAAIVYELYNGSTASIKAFGLSFIVGTVWDPALKNVFGALPLIWGTLVTSAIALILAVPLSIGIGILLSEFAPRVVRFPFSLLVELLAAIPSVIYGLWGIFVLAPALRSTVYPAIQGVLGFIPLFSGEITGFGVLTAGIVLAIMIIPTITAVSREVFSSVPNTQREAFFSIGATQWETAKHVVSYARSGVIGAVMLGLGRAIGETMAVTMVIGNRFEIPNSLFQAGYTMSALIANEFNEANGALYVSSIVEVGLVLFLVTLLVSGLARALVWRSLRMHKGASME